MTIHTKWFSVHPERSWQMWFWYKVNEQRLKKGVKVSDLVGIKCIAEDVELSLKQADLILET